MPSELTIISYLLLASLILIGAWVIRASLRPKTILNETGSLTPQQVRQTAQTVWAGSMVLAAAIGLGLMMFTAVSLPNLSTTGWLLVLILFFGMLLLLPLLMVILLTSHYQHLLSWFSGQLEPPRANSAPSAPAAPANLKE